MELWHVIVLALVQALTEFLPVSSSGHLGLVGFFLGWPYQGLTFDLALHFGTLTAVVIYYRKDLWRMTAAVFSREDSPTAHAHRRLGWGLVLSTIPAVIVGLSMSDAFVESLRTPWLIAVDLIVFGILLGLADRFGSRQRDVWSMSFRDASLIGLAQALALIPGVSRSGITMTALLAMGLTRIDAARYAFLMSVPIVAAAAAHGLMSIWRAGDSIDITAFAVGAGVAAVAGLACIHLLIGLLKRFGMMPFVVYRIALGLAVIALLLMRVG